MAEILGVVASGISVAQIAGQLLSCIQQLRTLCRVLRDIFYQLGAFKTDSSQPGYSALRASLVQCHNAASKLEAVAKAGSEPLQSNKSRKWFLIKAVLKREEVKDLKTQLEAAKSLLHLAVTCYSL
jgi:hypothetical protein